MQSMDVEKISIVLKKAVDIDIRTRAKTFFDVSGFPHYENVISNILAFFFDVNEEHGFKDLWLKSLFECYNMRANTNLQPGEFEEIERELPTDDKKRIDILISLDNTIVAIENKIYASPDNPFDSYHEKLKKIIEKNEYNKSIVEILLSLKKENDQKTEFGTLFYNITYQSLVEQVKKNIGDYIENANEKWLLFMKEVLNNIESLGEVDAMNKEWQTFFEGNQEIISCFFANYSNDIDAKIKFIKNLEQGVKERLIDCNSRIGTYNTQNCESFSGYISMFIDMPKGEDTIVIEPFIERKKPFSLVLELWNRNKKRGKEYSWSKELDLLKEDYPDAKVIEDGDWGMCLRLKELDFENDMLETVINKVVSIYQTINQ